MLRALLLSAALASAGADEVKLDGIDVYGSSRLSSAEAIQRYGKEIDGYIRLKNRKTKAAERSAKELKARIEAKIKNDWKLFWVQLSPMDYYVEGAHKAFVTIDAVEARDKELRWGFRKAPAQSFPDPGGLLAAWNEYMDLGWSLLRKGHISVNHDACLAVFCQWGTQTPELRAFEERFIAQAPQHKEALLKIMLSDRETSKRSAAVYLLSYLKDPNESSKLIVEALKDPEVDVRSAALRVYADLAVYHRGVFLPTFQIIAALDFPAVDDRNKALAVVAGLANDSVYRNFLIQKAAPQMLALLQQSQPVVQDTAYAALGILSKEGFDRKDIESWRQWIERSQKQENAASSADKASE